MGTATDSRSPSLLETKHFDERKSDGSPHFLPWDHFYHGLPGAPLRLWRLLVTLAALALSCGVPQSPTHSSSTLRFVWTGDLTPLWHPAGYQTFSQAVVLSLVFNNLVKLDDDLKTVMPDLAETWEMSPDMTVFTFHRRKGVTWHDGQPFTAQDVIFSFTRQVVEPYRYVKYMNALKGSRDYKDGKSNEIEGLEQLDQYTVRITLSAPDSLFLLNLTEPSCVIVPKHLLRDVDPDSIESATFTTTSPIGGCPIVRRK